MNQFRSGAAPRALRDHGVAWPRIAVAAALLLGAAIPLRAQTVDAFAPHGGRGNVVVITGTGLSGAEAVLFGGTPASGFTIDSATQITATAPAAFSTGPVSVDLGVDGVVSSRFHYVSRAAAPDLVGLVGRNALPLGATVDVAPLLDNAFGQAGGVNYTFSAMALPASTWVYFGADQGNIGISMNNDNPSGDELMTYAEADSDLASGRIVYRGSSVLPIAQPASSATLCTRFVVQIQADPPGVPVIAVADVPGLPPGVGAVAAIPPGAGFTANLLMEAAYQPCTSWQPALQLYDQASTHPGMLAYSTYTTGFFYENTAPELSAIDDQLVADGGSTPALPFTMDDAETGVAGIAFSVSSSDLTFVPEANIAVVGDESERTIAVTAVAGVPGPSTITLHAEDASGTVTQEAFTVGQLTLPTISDVDDVLVQVTEPTDAIAFSVDDPQSAPGDLVVTASSSDQTLLPDANLVLGGSDGSRTLVATPAGSQTGQATITLTVTDPDANSSADTFVLTVNARPSLTANVAPTVVRGAEVVYTDTNLHAVDAESGDDALRYTLAPNGIGSAGHNGSVRLDGAVLAAGDSFTQQDIDAGLVAFLHDGSCNAPASFTFDVDDGMGGFARAPASPFSANVLVTLPNDAPAAQDQALAVPMGGSASGQVQGSDEDCLQEDALSYALSLAVVPAKGTVSAFDSTTGAFTYTAAPGESGQDSFGFEVSDGTSAALGTVTVSISNSTPVADGASLATSERTAVSAVLTASDADLPPQTLTFAIGTPPAKGTLSAFDPASGSYTYTPAANRIGDDVFDFTVSDGALTSAVATVDIRIRAIIDNGDIAVADAGGPDELDTAQVVLVDPVSGDQYQLSSGDLLGDDELHGIAFDANGDVVVIDNGGVLLHIDGDTGDQTALATLTGLALGLDIDADGSILVALGPNGVQRLAADGTLLQAYADAEMQLATDVDVMEGGRLVVTDAGGFPPVPADADVLYFEPETGVATALPVAGLEFPISIARLANGNLVLGDGVPAFGSSGSAIEIIDGLTGSIIDSISGAHVDGITGIDVNAAGSMYAASTGTLSVLEVDAGEAVATPVSSAGMLFKPWGIAVFSGPDAIFKDGFEEPPAPN